MRVVVVGGSGNVGTALLRRLSGDQAITSVAAVARRTPASTPVPPYDVAEWTSCDVGAQGADGPIVDRLARVFAGADAVVNLAWAIQPSHVRDRLRRTNVVGAQRVVAATAAAGVPHLAAASSVGAYSPVDDDVPRSEDWPTEGIPSSSYSVDKAQVERVLDDAERRFPELTITRVRPALVFQHDAGHEIGRYFLGPLVPRAALRGRLPVLPWPRGLRLQAVHADDLADAYREVLVRRTAGAVNIAGPGVIRAQDVAELLSQGRWLEAPVPLARAAITAGWRARAVPVGPGWLDMAMSAPLLNTTRAHHELGLRPQRSGIQALADLLPGIAAGAGAGSPPLRAAKGGRTRRRTATGQADRARQDDAPHGASRQPTTEGKHQASQDGGS
ncbi:NAD-dependent epimerase/dehydratase family protein [Cellulomonas chengniuliangii]|uniref:NAD-dependent epimerase/dehydratase family protein n=1 Tax=Cellulomonas chengniuliangii TaxID=2968084 RepID=A0ABY5L160_9CELL|nr:NAD-dependent epimerase/dehydratase family protein [Cellulomonas chengniuliangii]MCC2307608.1 NAD-dependent epimerase/dehydratase family protein [Cellulomonas chengniuliangii]UUI75624.1 NAD-dependent epimerase/dehydratase family protein [Cellulomonas chengniuliangii]